MSTDICMRGDIILLSYKFRCSQEVITIVILLAFRDLVSCDIINPYSIFTWKNGEDTLDTISDDLDQMQDTVNKVMTTLDKKQTMEYIGTVKHALNIFMDKFIVDNINRDSKKYYASTSGVFVIGHVFDPNTNQYIPRIAMDKKKDNPNDYAYKINVNFSINICVDNIEAVELPNGKKLTETEKEFKEFMDKEIFFVNIIDIWHREDPLIGAVCRVSENDDWFFYN